LTNLMRSKRTIVIFLLSCVTLLGLILAFKSPGEPIYEGKRLSTWLSELPESQTYGEQGTRAVNAVRAMGTNALPPLIRMLRAEDSRLKEQVRNLLYQQKLIRIRLSHPAIFQRVLACRGLRVLGPLAAPVIPQLEETLLSRDPDMSIPGVLLSIGPPAWPVFQRTMTNANAEIRLSTIGALWIATNRLEQATPALMHLMTNDPLPSLRLYAAITLAKTGKHEDSVVPVLLGGLRLGNDTGFEAARAFIHYPLAAKEHMSALMAVAEGDDIIASFGALDVLKRIDPAAAVAAEKTRQSKVAQSK
jgi:hypothetical protein